MQMISIRFCKTDEIEKLQKFLNDFWKKDHILSLDKNLLLFQHKNVASQSELNFVIAIDKSTDEFLAVLGFIPTNRYDDSISETHLWLAIWCKNNENHLTKGLGKKLLDFLIYQRKPSSIGSIGINDEVKKLYEKLGFTTGKLSHYYFSSPSIENGLTKNILYYNKITYSGCSIVKDEFNLYDFPFKTSSIPHKTAEYFLNRYRDEKPPYKYSFYKILDQSNNIIEIIVVRKINYNNKSCLRIVDCFNNFEYVSNISDCLEGLIRGENAQYIDCYNNGIMPSKFIEMGFRLKFGTIVIPNYFDPFIDENVEIQFAYKILDKNISDEYIIFKGDSDQDRPNIYKEKYE